MRRGDQVIHHLDLPALTEAAGFSFALPVELPSGFLQTDLALINGRTVRVQYDDGSASFCYGLPQKPMMVMLLT